MMTFQQVTKFSNEIADRHGLPRYYKVVKRNGHATHANIFWPLPRSDHPGRWVSVDGRLVVCRNGIHACRLSDLPMWCNPNFHLYEIELDEGGMIHASNKVCSRAGRLVRRLELDVRLVRNHNNEFTAPEDRWDLHGSNVHAAAATVHLLLGGRQRNVDGMIEQLVAEQLAA